MPMLSTEHMGSRIAGERKIRGLTQRQLAEEAFVSLSLLRQVERGAKPATAALIASVARVLQVDSTRLTGQPYLTGDRREDAIYGVVTEIRRELVAYRIAPAEDRPVPTLDQLRAATAEISRLRHRVDLLALGRQLPLALADLRFASHVYTGRDREQVMALLAEVYYATRQLLHKLGYLDLASLVADRYEWAAAQSGDPMPVALAAVFRAGELDHAGDWRSARAIMADTVESFDIGPAAPERLSVWGFLHLMSAYMAAHAGDEDVTWAHHAEARETADRLGADRDDYRLAFGPTNVAIWGTALGVELMDGAKAIERSHHVRLTPQTPPERAGHHYIDLARGQLLYGKRREALQSLLAARRVAPQQVRYHPMARETVFALAKAERHSSETLRGLATWMGLGD
jgi:transcriptional regulator with XRE-family HTH domain